MPGVSTAIIRSTISYPIFRMTQFAAVRAGLRCYGRRLPYAGSTITFVLTGVRE